jgi:outer membrane protein, heavy metal efflux system
MTLLRPHTCRCQSAMVWMALAISVMPSLARGQERLSLQGAIDEALATRPSIKADAERVAAARGLQEQAGARPNGDLQFSSENLRRGQTYSRDVDTLALVTQPLDLVGRRHARLAVAGQRVEEASAGAEAGRVAVLRAVTDAYWEAREAQDARDVLNATVETFQQIEAYHSAQFQVGMIPEQDLLRVRLESERLKVAAGEGALDAMRARALLLKVMGRPATTDVTLTDPLDVDTSPPPVLSDSAVLAAHAEIKAAEAAVAQAHANVHLQTVLGRPEFSGLFGYKRTLLPDATTGVNTMVAGVRVTLPWGDRNTGNRSAASAELRRQQDLLDAARAEILADYHAALDDYAARRQEVTNLVVPLRAHAANLAQLAQAAYVQGGTDLLRLLDARRAQLDADLAWVHAMADWQMSAAALKFAGGQVK